MTGTGRLPGRATSVSGAGGCFPWDGTGLFPPHYTFIDVCTHIYTDTNVHTRPPPPPLLFARRSTPCEGQASRSLARELRGWRRFPAHPHVTAHASRGARVGRRAGGAGSEA